MQMIKRALNFLAGLFVGLLAAGLLSLVTSKPQGTPITLLPAPTPAPIKVHVSGAVLRSGVYTLPPESIVKDAIDAAGGPLPEANTDLINLAEPLLDGHKIYLAGSEKDPNSNLTPMHSSNFQSPSEKVNINTASAPELEKLPGIGPALAEKIVGFRRAQGPFLTRDDLLLVSGIGPAKLEVLKDLITVHPMNP
jgi:competence protein ComEA